MKKRATYHDAVFSVCALLVATSLAACVPAPASSPDEASSTAEAASALADAPDTATSASQASLEDYSWDELKSIAEQIAAAASDEAGLSIARQAGLLGADGLLTGDTKDVEVSGFDMGAVRIVGFRHDQKADGTGVAGITFEFVNSPASHVMNTMPEDNIFGFNDGGWEASEMRAWLNAELLAALPEDLQASVVEVNKPVADAGEDVTVSEVADPLWLLSASEVFGPSGNDGTDGGSAAYADEGEQYQFYAEGTTPPTSHSLAQKTGTDTYWWLRTPTMGSSSGFRIVRANGSLASSNAYYSFGVSPGFCL